MSLRVALALALVSLFFWEADAFLDLSFLPVSRNCDLVVLLPRISDLSGFDFCLGADLAGACLSLERRGNFSWARALGRD